MLCQLQRKILQFHPDFLQKHQDNHYLTHLSQIQIHWIQFQGILHHLREALWSKRHFFQLELSSLNFCAIKVNQSNFFIFIFGYFKTCYSKNHVKKVARSLEVIIWSLRFINAPFVAKGLKCKKMFLFEKFDNNIQFNLCWCKAGYFFIWGLKQVVGKESIYKTEGTKRICPSQQDLGFREWLIYADFTHCIMIICKYLIHKPAYQRSGLNTCKFVSLF